MRLSRKPQIKLGDHVFTCGQTGSGKTYLTQAYTAAFENVVVYDTKGMFNWGGFVKDVPVFESLKELMEFKQGKCIYRPNINELNKEYYERFFEWIYWRKNCWVNCDELMSFTDTTYIPFYLKAIYTRGRERNTSVWGCTQRPKTIPLVCMSEATHYFIFSLKLLADRKRVQEFIPHDEILEEIQRDSHQFYYYNDKLDKPIKAKLV